MQKHEKWKAQEIDGRYRKFCLEPELLYCHALNCIFIQVFFQLFAGPRVIIIQQQNVKPFHVLIRNCKHSSARFNQYFIGKALLVRLLPSQKNCPWVPHTKASSAFSVAVAYGRRICSSPSLTVSYSGTGEHSLFRKFPRCPCEAFPTPAPRYWQLIHSAYKNSLCPLVHELYPADISRHRAYSG